MYIEDKIDVSKLSSRKITPEGYLIAEAVFTKAGVQYYDESIITGNPKDVGNVVGVYRPESVITDDKTIESLKRKPITIDHPPENVNASNYKMYSVGITGENITKVKDGRISGTVQFYDKDVIESINKNILREISLGYEANTFKKDGEYRGEKYQYVFDGGMGVNHCAVVKSGRCGSEVSILDKAEDKKVDEENNKNEIVIKDSDSSNEADVSNNKRTKENTKKDDQHGKEKMMLDNAELEKMIFDKANEIAIKRSNAMNLGQVFLGDSVDFSAMTDRQIIESAYKKAINDSDDISKKSDDYLLGALSAARNNQQKAKAQQVTISDSIKSTTTQDAKYFSALECRAMKKRS